VIRSIKAWRGGIECLSDGLNVHGLGTLDVVLGVKGDPGAFGERAIPVAADDRRVMNEQILGLVIGGDEPEALSSLNHFTVPVAIAALLISRNGRGEL